MGCYGIGITRLVAAAIEVLSTDDQLKLPRIIAPYSLVIIPQKVRLEMLSPQKKCDALFWSR